MLLVMPTGAGKSLCYQLPGLARAGTTLVVRGAMDNSERNPGNPDPSRPVHFGLQTEHDLRAFHDYILHEADGQMLPDGTVQAFGRRFRAAAVLTLP